MKPSRSKPPRPVGIGVIRKLHLYTALSLGLVFSLFGLAGSWLSFYPHLDGALLGFDTHQGWRNQPVSWNATHRAAQAATGPGQGMSGIMMPFGDAGPVIVFNQTRPDATPLDYDMVYVDPAQARVLSARAMLSREQSLSGNMAGIAYAIHSGLVLGPAGHLIVVALGLLLLFVIITGLVVWWPRGPWRRSAFMLLSRIGSRAFIGDLHRISGLYISLFLGMLVITGIYYAVPDVITKAVDAAFPTTPRPQHSMAMHAAEHVAHDADIDRAVEVARTAFPARSLQMLMWMPDGSVQVNLSPRDGASRVGATEVSVGSNGALLSIRDPSAETTGDAILRWQMPLHTGAAFGTAGRAIICFIGFMPLAFFITGVILWWRRTRSAARARAQRGGVRRDAVASA